MAVVSTGASSPQPDEPLPLAKGDPVDVPMLVGPSWRIAGPRASDRMAVHDPYDDSLIAVVPRANDNDVEDALAFACEGRILARALPRHRRMAILASVAARIEADREAFALLIAREGVKTIREARLEVQRCAETIRLAAEEARRLTGETIGFDQRPGSDERFGYVEREPIGIVLAITPFNDPLNLVAHKIAPAIAAGNAVILKPHEQTPLCALKLARTFIEAGLPPGILQVITGEGRQIGDQLVTDSRVTMVSFTGGESVGKHIQRLAGVKKIALELGGNCPTIVMADADIDRAARRCVSGAFWAAGQNCLHVQRVLVHASVADELTTRMRDLTSRYQLGSKIDEATDMGCLVDAAAGDRIVKSVGSALQAGARCVIGGTGAGTRYEPTLLMDVPDLHPLMVDEVFGPVTSISPFETVEEAIHAANATRFGLQAAVFTRDLNLAKSMTRALDVGAVIINDSTDYRIDAMPFGGTKASGLGREGVLSAMLEMSEPKVVCFDHGPA
jgi:glyceraldehyde-3-phosphate dehydrogenase (NADP+)